MESLAARDQMACCQVTQQSFLRLITTEAIMRTFGCAPLSNAQAWKKWEEMDSFTPELILLPVPDGLNAHWQSYSSRPTPSPKLWMDAYLAAFARAADCRMVTFDGGFRRFKGLDLMLLGV